MVSAMRLGRYELFEEIARGGTAAVHLGRTANAVGFSKVVAVKRVFPMLSGDPEFVAMFRDEVRLATRVRHANVVAPLDADTEGDELFLVMDYVHGASLSRLLRIAAETKAMVPTRVALRILIDVLEGLHAAHTAKDERGAPLGIVHRDVSPHNILVGVDGTAKVVDFGIAKASVRATTTREGHLKGKLGYMAPEQLSGEEEDARTDVYGAAVVLWETLTCERLFQGTNEGNLLARVLEGVLTPPDRLRKDLSSALNDAVLRGLSRDRTVRFQSAREMALALESIEAPAAAREVGEWVSLLGGEALAKQRERIDEIERGEERVAPAASSLPSDDMPTLTADAPQMQEDDVRPRSRRNLVLVAAVIAFLGAGAALFGLFAQRAQKNVLSPQVLASVPDLQTPAPPTPVAASALSSVSAAPSAPVAASSARTAPPATKAQPHKSPDCSTPTFVDARGIRRIKPGCL